MANERLHHAATKGGCDKSDTSDKELQEEPVSPIMTRRRALQVLGAVPVAAAIGQQPTTPQAPLTPGVTTQVPVKPGQTPGVATGPRFFNRHEWKTVALLADYVIPRDEHSGSATDAKVPEYIDYLLSEKDANVNTQIAMHGGLAWLDTESHKRFGKAFVDASDAQRREMLDDIAYPAKA